MTLKNLSPIQIEIMEILWRIPEASVSDVTSHLDSRSYARTTVATMLARLEKQEIVKSKKINNVNLYSAVIKESTVREASISSLIKAFFNNEKAGLVSHLISENVSSEELNRLSDLVEKLKKDKTNKRNQNTESLK